MNDLRAAMDAQLRLIRREMNGCESVGENHVYGRHRIGTPVVVDKNRKILGDIRAIDDPRADHIEPGFTLGKFCCVYCGALPVTTPTGEKP